MNVLLINPPQDNALPSEASVAPRKGTGPYPPLGLMYLEAALLRAGHEARVLDLSLPGTFTWPEFDGGPDLVGLGVMTPNLPGVTEVIELVRKRFPKARVMIGGPHTKLFAREAAMLDGVDYVLAGEAEERLPLVVDRLAGGEARPDVPGLLVRDGEAVHGDDGAPLPMDLDALATPVRSRTDPTRYVGFVGTKGLFTTMNSSRGCAFKCTFCSTPRGDLRYRGAESLVEEMRDCRSLGIEHVYFVDDLYPTKKHRLYPRCEALIQADLGLTWSCRTVAAGLAEESMRLMKRAGCTRIQIGAEAGTDEGLRVINKPATTALIRETFERARRVGIETMAYFIIGLPQERTPADAMETVAFAKSIRPTYVMFNVLTLYPGTAMYDDARKKAWSRAIRGSIRAAAVAELCRAPLERAHGREAAFLASGPRLSLVLLEAEDSRPRTIVRRGSPRSVGTHEGRAVHAAGGRERRGLTPRAFRASSGTSSTTFPDRD
ncbi:MAG: B12-binding domain-containing radical SAM protein [Deltaproteobacteria bacterium]|nr:B12-binding domain-containing radical SAM protein [Deltaproteobacteria bacterium]